MVMFNFFCRSPWFILMDNPLHPVFLTGERCDPPFYHWHPIFRVKGVPNPCSKHLIHGYPTSYYFSTLNATQRQKPSYPTSYISIPNDGDDPTLQESQRDTSLAITQAINRSQMMGTIQCYKCHRGTQA